MHVLIHFLIIILVIRWVIVPVVRSFFRTGPPDRYYRKMKGEQKRFQAQVLAELKRQSDAVEKQNETLTRILERLGGSSEAPAPPDEHSQPSPFLRIRRRRHGGSVCGAGAAAAAFDHRRAGRHRGHPETRGVRGRRGSARGSRCPARSACSRRSSCCRRHWCASSS